MLKLSRKVRTPTPHPCHTQMDYGKGDIHSFQQGNTLRRLKAPHEHQLEFVSEQLFQYVEKGIAD